MSVARDITLGFHQFVPQKLLPDVRVVSGGPEDVSFRKMILRVSRACDDSSMQFMFVPATMHSGPVNHYAIKTFL